MTGPKTLAEKIWEAHVVDSPLAEAARHEALGDEAPVACRPTCSTSTSTSCTR